MMIIVCVFPPPLVFQSKVLQKLYPAAPTPVEPIAQHVAGGLAKDLGKRKDCTITGKITFNSASCPLFFFYPLPFLENHN